MQADNASAAKKKTKQDNHYVTMSFKNGVLTVKGNGGSHKYNSVWG